MMKSPTRFCYKSYVLRVLLLHRFGVRYMVGKKLLTRCHFLQRSFSPQNGDDEGGGIDSIGDLFLALDRGASKP